eukprot:CAMPEP_0184711106 /NCGR_PEP_ID=MMETSP0314-20130426/1814_1 /TAXON_ID=38298 /ORGANISM="Rhodella maculata, Strain CCMP 736" /LENGTH=75 /DNA_ID=CAMNT_0027173131 /DNA_START=146 /DNA_END=369 /DNA_ORIENTATION=+
MTLVPLSGNHRWGTECSLEDHGITKRVPDPPADAAGGVAVYAGEPADRGSVAAEHMGRWDWRTASTEALPNEVGE